MEKKLDIDLIYHNKVDRNQNSLKVADITLALSKYDNEKGIFRKINGLFGNELDSISTLITFYRKNY